jgi:two-component system, sensor histidine kinase
MSPIDSSFAATLRKPAVDVQAEIARESMTIRCRQSIQSLPSMTVVLTLTGTLLWGAVDDGRLLAWIGACFAMTAMRAAACAWVLRRIAGASRDQLDAYEWWLAATTIANTVAMGSGVWWVATVGSIEVQYFVTLTTCLYSVGSLVNASTNAPVFIAGVAANLGQTIAFWMLQGVDGMKIAVPLVVIALLLVAFGRANARAFAESVRMRYRNLDLVAELSEEKKAVEHALSIAQEASQSKSRFLAAASHDLRQPLHALRLQVGTISLHATGGPVRQSVDRTLEMLESLDELFRNLLDLSRFDAGALKPRVQVFMVAELFAHLEGEFRLLAEAKGLRFETRPVQARVQTDLLLLERLLRNLLSNAIRYTASGSVILAARLQDGNVALSVADTGPGIAPEQREHIFEEFVQIRGGAEGGVGLGLAIVRRIDALLGLGLNLVSETGRGSEFSVKLKEAVA